MSVRGKGASGPSWYSGASSPSGHVWERMGQAAPFLVIHESEGGKQPTWSVVSEGRVTHQVVGESEGEVTTGL